MKRHSRKSLGLVALGAACCLSAANALADEPIGTDRPDFTESSDVVGRGRFQLETSVAYERDRQAGVRTRVTSMPTLLRWGVSDDLELRVESDGYLRAHADGAGGSVRERGWGDASFGIKWHVRDGEEGGRPAIGLLLHADVDSGSAAFRGQGVRPSLRVVGEWELADDWSVGVMPGIAVERNDGGRRYTYGLVSVVVGKSFTDRLHGFVELAGQQFASRRNGGNVVSFNTGASYLLNDSMQVDASVELGTNSRTPDAVWSVGFSIRF